MPADCSHAAAAEFVPNGTLSRSTSGTEDGLGTGGHFVKRNRGFTRHNPNSKRYGMIRYD
jgi:hypothetical protein